MYDTKNYYVQKEWKVTKSGHQYQTCQPCIYPVPKHKIWYILTQYFRGFTGAWKRQEEYESVLVIILYVLLLLYRKNMYWYVQRAKYHGPKMTWFECWHRNWVGRCVDGRNRRDFSVGDRGWLDFSVGVRIDLVSCGGRKQLGLESRSELPCFSRRVACKIDLFLEWGYKLTRRQCWGRNKLGFMWGYKLTWS